MTENAAYGVVLDRSADDVWQVVRDFDGYPVWVDGVEGGHLEDGLPGTAVGAVRNFAPGGGCTRRRLAAHSDVDRPGTVPRPYGSPARAGTRELRR